MSDISTLSFNERETEKIRETVELYLFVKELLLYNEIIDPNSYTFPQVINELRNAYDHFNRVIAEKLNIIEKKEDNYSIETLNKALGHVYRACYDTLDWLSVNIREDLIKELKPFSHDAIKEVIPNYYSEISVTIPKYERRISELKAQKDISSINSNDLNEFAEIVKNLGDIRQKVKDSLDALIDFDKRRRKEGLLLDFRNLIIGLIIGLVGVVLGVLLEW